MLRQRICCLVVDAGAVPADFRKLTVCRSFRYPDIMTKILLGRRGVITIPSSLRKRYGLLQNDELLVEDTGQGLLLRPCVSMPVEIYTEERIKEFSRDDEAIAKNLDAGSRLSAAR